MSSTSGSEGLFRRASLPTSFSKPSEKFEKEEKAFSSSSAGLGRSRKECFVFEPQQWRKTVCKNCFRTKVEHRPPGGDETNPNPNTPTSGDSTPVSSTAPGTPIPSSAPLDPFKLPVQKETSNSNAIRAAARKNAVSQRASEEHRGTQESRRPLSGGSFGSTVYSSISSIDARYIEELENDFFALEDQHEAILRERNELKLELESKVRTISDLHTTLEQYREKVNLLERRSLHLEEEVNTYRERLRLPESDQSRQPIGEETSTNQGESPYSGELQQRLNEVELLCQEVMEENEQLKEEVEEMQREVEEMHDHFQEDDRDTMRELQRDLESANKTCRILQFKLRKAERRFEQCDAERISLEERLARLEAELYSEADVAHIRNLEEEIRVAKEVGVRLNNELDVLDEKRSFFEEENRQLKEELQACHNRRISVENELGRRKLEIEKLRSENVGALQVTDKNRSSQAGYPTGQVANAFEMQQMQRELDASRERETDVCEQLRYAEEEVRKMKRRLKESQMENEVAAKKMDRILTMQLREPFAYGQPPPNTNNTQNNNNCNRGPEGQPTSATGDARVNAATGGGRNQLEFELEMVTKQLEYMSDENGELKRKLSLTGDQSESRQVEGELNRFRAEGDQLRSALNEWDKQLRTLVREVNLINATEKDQQWMKKYNEAMDTVKTQEEQLYRAKKRMSEIQEENSRLQASNRRTDDRQKQRGKGERNASSTSRMSKEALCNEITSLEEEIDGLTSDLTASRELVSSAQLRVTCLEETVQDLRLEKQRREGELTNSVFSLENRCSVTNRLLELTRSRVETLQADVDELTSRGFPESAGVLTNGKDYHNEEIDRLKNTVAFLKGSLEEETRKNQILETQVKQRSGTDAEARFEAVDSTLRLKQMDILKKELEEKDELLEVKEEQFTDMKVRLDQARKMNDALRALLEKDSDEVRPSGGMQKTELTIEMASYKKEIDSLRKEMQILRTNLGQAKNQREKLLKENKELQEELKLREDSIFDQDDEIDKRNTEIRNLKVSLEEVLKELEQTKQELSVAKSREASSHTGRISAQTEKLRNDLNDTTKQLTEMKQLYEESKRSATLAEEKFNQTCAELNQVRNSIQERESNIFDLNMNLKRVKEELQQAKSLQQTLEGEKAGLHQQLMETRNVLANTEHEMTKLHSQMLALNQEKTTQESAISLSEVSSREPTLSRRSADVDRLRRELSLMQRERDDLLVEVKRLRSNIEKQQHLKEFGQKDPSRNLITLPTGNAYAKAVAAKQVSTKISLLNEHITTVTRTNVELKLHNESMHNTVLDYQRRYRNLKEQYECEQEAWLTERVVLESKAKEQEERKSTLLNTRKLLQETTIKLCELEATSSQKLADLQSAYRTLEEEMISLEHKLTKMQEQQKVPKVLQRFSGTTSVNGRPTIGSNPARLTSPEVTLETSRRVENAERTIAKLRTELSEVRESRQKQQQAAIQEAERARHLAEQEAEDLRDRLVTMECYRQQTELFRHRQFEVEEMAEKEFKIWQEEREQLLSRCEEAKAMLEHWCTQLQYRTDNEAEKAEDVVSDVIKQMEKWRSSRGRVACVKQRMMADSTYSFDGASTSVGSVPTSPGFVISKPGGGGGTLRSGQAQRSTSMEWGIASSQSGMNSRLMSVGGWLSGAHMRESSLGLITHGGAVAGNLRGSTLSLAVGSASQYSLMTNSRCGRSVSPEVSVKKISNYPDPTPGFLVRPSSRQGSQDSLCSLGDYTQRSFTLPGKPPIRSAISPARRKFFEDPPVGSTVKAPAAQNLHPPAEFLKEITKSSDKATPTPRSEEEKPPKPSSRSTAAAASDTSSSSASGDTTTKPENKRKSSKSKEPKKSTAEPSSSTEPPVRKSESISDRFSRLKSIGKTRSPRSGSTEPSNSPKLGDSLSKDSPGKQTVTSSTTQPLKTTRAVSQPAGQKPPTKASVSVSNISPSIMALRQKFSGGASKG